MRRYTFFYRKWNAWRVVKFPFPKFDPLLEVYFLVLDYEGKNASDEEERQINYERL